MQGGADRLTAAGPAKPLAHPADQALEGPAGSRVDTGYRRSGGDALGDADGRTKAGLDAGAKGGRPPVRR
jgi:hypothetical protein